MFRSTAATILAAVAVATPTLCEDASAAERAPYGTDALTWRLPPDYLRHLPNDGAVLTVPRAITELDVWLRGRDGRPRYRLRHRHERFDTVRNRGRFVRRCVESERYVCHTVFTRARGRRVLAAYSPINRDLYTWTDSARYGLVVYGWAS